MGSNRGRVARLRLIAEVEFSWRGGRRGNHGRIRRMYKDRAAYFGLAERVTEGCEPGQTGR